MFTVLFTCPEGKVIKLFISGDKVNITSRYKVISGDKVVMITHSGLDLSILLFLSIENLARYAYLKKQLLFSVPTGYIGVSLVISSKTIVDQI